MDERQAQVKEGAGLDEGRINQDFIDLLQKWSTPVLLMLTAAAVLWWGWQTFERMNYETRDEAFSQLADALAGSSVNPLLLESIANDYSGVPDVAILAKQSAASAYLASIIRGLEPDALIEEDGTLSNPDAILDADESARFAQRARSLFNEVLQMTEGKAARAVVAMNAAYGLAALAETQGDTADAVRWYERAAEIAEAGGYDVQARLARDRAASAESLPEVTLYTEAQIARLPRPEAPAAGTDQRERLGVIGVPDVMGQGDQGEPGEAPDSVLPTTDPSVLPPPVPTVDPSPEPAPEPNPDDGTGDDTEDDGGDAQTPPAG